ncbi:MAG: hypothetical protein WBO46_16780 [Caldilineaceae bacterium]
MAPSPQTIQIELAEPVYRRLQRASELTYRPIDEILSSALTVALGLPPDLPAESQAELAAMGMLSDAGLWAASESTLSPAQQRRLRQLNHAAGERKLSSSEEREQAQLLELYQRSVLQRAQALALLAYRGYDLPERADLPDQPDVDDDGLDF